MSDPDFSCGTDGRTDGPTEGSTRGPRGPKNCSYCKSEIKSPQQFGCPCTVAKRQSGAEQYLDAAMSLRELCPQAFEGVGCTFLHIQCCLLHILQGWQVEKVLVLMQILNEKTAAPCKFTWPSGLCNALMPHSGF